MQPRQWLESQLSDGAAVALPWVSVLAFMRLVTNPRVFRNSIGPDDAWMVVQQLLALETVRIAHTTARHSAVFAELVAAVQPHGNDITDTHLAARGSRRSRSSTT